MLEKHVQRNIADFLNAKQLLWCHVPNEEKALSRIKKTNKDWFWGILTELEKQGRKKGVPDILIFNTPPAFPDKKGLALELKRDDPKAKPSDEQMKWLVDLNKQGWLCAVANGQDEALRKLQLAGF